MWANNVSELFSMDGQQTNNSTGAKKNDGKTRTKNRWKTNELILHGIVFDGPFYIHLVLARSSSIYLIYYIYFFSSCQPVCQPANQIVTLRCLALYCVVWLFVLFFFALRFITLMMTVVFCCCLCNLRLAHQSLANNSVCFMVDYSSFCNFFHLFHYLRVHVVDATATTASSTQFRQHIFEYSRNCN